ncbi:MAG: hypothetical protein IJT08_01920 [Alphaproteobacteria bacterium]|nr:hypothetical protein [Alphaproteobacteria bacterium]
MKLFEKVKTSPFEREIYVLGRKIFSYSNMKLGVSYNLFDGEELLEPSARAIRKSAQYINVIYQNVSNRGEKRDDDLGVMLHELKLRGVIDEYILYAPDLSRKPSYNEKKKRVIGFELVKKRGCSHFLGMDVDEFYHHEEVERAKEKILTWNIKISAVSKIEYWANPELQVIDCARYEAFVPFIVKTTVSQKVTLDGYFPCLVDPTRKVKGHGRFFLFPKQEVVMHHMSSVRNDLEKKYRNSTYNPELTKSYCKELKNAKFDEKLPDGFYWSKNKVVRKVPDVFNVGAYLKKK